MAPRPEPQPGLARAIRQLRRERNWSQEELGFRAGLDRSWIGHLESGRLNPLWGTVRKIARAFEVELADLAALAEKLEHEKAPRP
ncbi:MAG TPA: helix-turn-helix transcriptional regulator [Solirubrobacterales bacterium]|jgi:transcriptional regulator with XRE-family HTH domain